MEAEYRKGAKSRTIQWVTARQASHQDITAEGRSCNPTDPRITAFPSSSSRLSMPSTSRCGRGSYIVRCPPMYGRPCCPRLFVPPCTSHLAARLQRCIHLETWRLSPECRHPTLAFSRQSHSCPTALSCRHRKPCTLRREHGSQYQLGPTKVPRLQCRGGSGWSPSQG